MVEGVMWARECYKIAPEGHENQDWLGFHGFSEERRREGLEHFNATPQRYFLHLPVYSIYILTFNQDVLMVWHSLMLNPRSYLEDCMRFGLKDLWATGMPWHAVNAAIDTYFNYQVPEAAKERFANATGHHWSNSKDHTSKKLNCPRCTQELKIPWTTCTTNEKPSLKE